MNRPTCETCANFDFTNEWPDDAGGHGTQWPQGTPLPQMVGRCRIYPTASPKKSPDEWCGQHSDFPAYVASLKTLTEDR